MFISKEIRWFSDKQNDQIYQWFTTKGLHFDTSPARTDFYLTDIDKDDMAPKIREGKIEIKYRIGETKKQALTPTAIGQLEDWVKWSFKLNDTDKLSAKVLDKLYTKDWTEVYKKRIGIKISKDANNAIQFHNINDRIDSGCQIEYTQIQIHGKQYYTFCLEWFGDEIITLPNSFYAEILGSSVLSMEDSMGYGGFLRRFQADTIV